MTDDPRQTIAALIDGAEVVDDARPAAPDFEESTRATFADGGDAESQAGGAFPGDYDGDEAGPSDKPPKSDVDMGAVEACAPLDHSDTDNGKRLIAHFGRDLLVLRQADAQRPAFVTWAGTHWDIDGGGPGSLALSQQVGGRIALEADYITATFSEKMAIERGDKAFDELDRLEAKKEPTDDDKARMRFLRKEIEDGLAAEQAVEKRQVARRKFAVSSKNKARLEAMLACAAPHIQRDPEAFNRDPLKFATRGHTLEFSRILDPDRVQEDPRADGTRPMIGWCEAFDRHRREDLITKLVPVDYDPDATCPKWDAFLAEFLPVEPVRRLVQTFSGLGLTGLTVQKILFHYGLGANGKSVFMETLMRVLGPLAVGLPAESITGTGERGAGQASPDLARLFGVRTLRILELPADKPLQEEMLKKLTGGESIPVRSLFKGYYEFTPVFSGHMSGNGYPRIDGTDNGIWRRMVVIHWPVTLAEERQRNIEDVLADFAPEYPGILNWLIEGACRYLTEGLVLPDEVKAATKDYRDEMDPIGLFAQDCVEVAAGQSVTAREMYLAYVAWSEANAKTPFKETRFGRVMKMRFRRDDGRVRHYLDCRLHDVPARPSAPRNPYEDDWDPR
jgi:putative DNA primase/helicase